jgi:acetate---CoA ligase (ADP-forming)
VLNTLLASDHCDLVLAVVGSSAQFQPEIAVEPIIEAEKHGKPLAVFLAPHAEESLKLLAKSGVAGFRTPESCADAIRAWHEWAPAADPPKADPAKLDAIAAILKSFQQPQLNEYNACRAFAALGVPQAATEIMTQPSQAVSVPYPVVAKILSPDIAHKTDAGGVALNVTDATALKKAAEDILARVRERKPGARLEGILVQRMERGLAEVILGYKRDPQVGPIVVLGIGGVLAEIYHDFAIRLAPVGVAEARRMIDEVKGLAVIRGYRGLPRGDCEALAQAISDCSQLAHVASIREAEINPLIVKAEGQGVVAVDGLIVKNP